MERFKERQMQRVERLAGHLTARLGAHAGVKAVVAAVLLFAACSPSSSSVQPVATPLSPADLIKDCPAFTAPPAGVSIPAPTDTSLQAVAQYNAARVLQTPRPIRNLYSLTQRLVTRSAAPIPCITRTTPRNEQVGHVQTFWVTNFTQTGYHQIQATLVYETPHLYMYLASGSQASLDAIKTAANTFESHTFDTDRRYYGRQWAPGPDDDQHITVLHVARLCECGGYFSSEDEYPRAVFRYSNERQMIYANLSGGAVPGEPYYDATLAHEFQHMIHWYTHPGDPSWTNEGMSVLAQHVNGYTSGNVERTFFALPDTMLGGWTDNQAADVAHYGAGYLFMDYFAEHYGGYPVLQELLRDPEQVPLNFNHVLAAHGYKERFDDVFANFVIANLLNSGGVGNGLYVYPSIQGQRAQVQHSANSYPFGDGGTVHQYATEYYDFQPAPAAGSRALTLDFKGNPYVGTVGNTPYNGASAEWWGNSGNYSDTTLTRAFDLGALGSGGGKPVALTFAAWYSLETDFDYAYVEVSTDGGKTWQTVKTSMSSATNPNGANYGNGITGISGGTEDLECGPAPQWVPVTADLSAYAGKQIQLRFETISDDAVHCPGLALDDIRIPTLGFTDDVSADNGWQAQGFIRSNNVLPQSYILQAVVYPASGAPNVVRIPVDAASGTAHDVIAGLGGQVAHVTLAVSATAPATIVPASYHLSAQLG
jgi:hypothetical protein